ncbi:hypothetical protein V5799_031932 [Amblyomma americanum]|uniref:Uncharacterized protein n=1 Tax=Amblyomma americanum TaxID=6943 RepID=A0AAQ4DSL8_AMBAM
MYRIDKPGVCAIDNKECSMDESQRRKGKQFEHCAQCSCSTGEQWCFKYDKRCNCDNGILYPINSASCVRHKSWCERPVRPDKNTMCLLCDCIGPDCEIGKCKCTEGIIYIKDTNMRCAHEASDCLSMGDERNTTGDSKTCARCECPSGEQRCSLYKGNCECINGDLYYKGTDSCPMNADDCGRPDWHKHYPNTTGCILCDCDQPTCNYGAMCHCIDGIVYPKDRSEECARKRGECFRKPQRHKHYPNKIGCILCDCDQPTCNYGATCHCIDGIVYPKDRSNECARQRGECFRRPHRYH